MENNITAKEFFVKFLAENENAGMTDIMIAFAKMHVEAQAKIISKLDFESITHPEANDYEEAVELTILGAYPLNLIK